MSYEVRFVEALPEGHDFALVKVRRDWVLFLERTRVTERTLEEAWAAYRLAATGPLPRQRVPA